MYTVINILNVRWPRTEDRIRCLSTDNSLISVFKGEIELHHAYVLTQCICSRRVKTETNPCSVCRCIISRLLHYVVDGRILSVFTFYCFTVNINKCILSLFVLFNLEKIKCYNLISSIDVNQMIRVSSVFFVTWY